MKSKIVLKLLLEYLFWEFQSRSRIQDQISIRSPQKSRLSYHSVGNKLNNIKYFKRFYQSSGAQDKILKTI